MKYFPIGSQKCSLDFRILNKSSFLYTVRVVLPLCHKHPVHGGPFKLFHDEIGPLDKHLRKSRSL